MEQMLGVFKQPTGMRGCGDCWALDGMGAGSGRAARRLCSVAGQGGCAYMGPEEGQVPPQWRGQDDREDEEEEQGGKEVGLGFVGSGGMGRQGLGTSACFVALAREAACRGRAWGSRVWSRWQLGCHARNLQESGQM